MSHAAALFRPLRAGPLRLKNRIAMAPMTREEAPGGVPTRAMARYYARRAAGGTGLIVTEGCAPDLAGAFSDRVPRLDSEAARAGWAEVVRGVRAHGAAIMLQLWHVGAFTPSLIGMADGFPADMRRVSPSGLAAPGRPFGAAMTAAEIDATIAAFADAARAAATLGFDGAEIHAAHGYLPDQFFWHGTNRRSDRYGGGLAARARFAAELVAAMKAAAGPDFAVSARVSQWKQLDYAARVADSPAAIVDWLGPVAEAGADLFHVSTRRFAEPAFEGSDATLAGLVRAATGLPVIAVGSVTLGTDFKSPLGKTRAAAAPEQVARIVKGIEAGEFDVIAIGRALLANPDWAERVARGEAARLRDFDRAMLDGLDNWLGAEA
ncbi:12-oxophytodienoate reductase [Rhodobacterales bacterium HKCCE2091]|nr:12-oxophytodienoate reductase [Rhodobacterales bacterium HKCCE2091]